jgi:hypothetical protein
MKVGNFITHTLIFLIAWIGLAFGSWGSAQVLSDSLLAPWVLSIVSFSPSTTAFAMGAAVAILGSCLAAVVLLVVLIALEAIVHRVVRPSSATPS